MAYCIYGKRVQPIRGITTESDKTFRPLDNQGIRVNKAQAARFSTYDEAEKFLAKQKLRKEAVFEIRRI